MLSRIVRFEKEPIFEPHLPDRHASKGSALVLDDEINRNDSIDFDSCISPLCGGGRAWSDAGDLLRLASGSFGRQRRSISYDEGHDYDSCMSPVSTPRWTLSQFEEFRKSAQSRSFSELHAMLLEGCISHFVARPSDDAGKVLEICPKIRPKSVIVSGSFNPLHHGHENLARRAVHEANHACGDYYFEISTFNVDKGPIPAAEMERRVDYIIARGHHCILSNATLFDAKAELFPNCIFAIGFDTYTRVINPKYYPRLTGGLDGTLARVEANGCEFFVGGRVSEGVYRSLTLPPTVRRVHDMDGSSDLELNVVELPELPKPSGCTIQPVNAQQEFFCEEEPMSPLFTGLPQFRFDISSTQIRNGEFQKSQAESSSP